MARIFVPNPNFDHDLTHSADNMVPLLEGLSGVAGVAQSVVRKRKGFLADGITYEVGTAEEHGGQYIGRLNSADFKSHWYEFGSARTPKDAFLRSSVEAHIGPVTGGDK